MKYENNSGYSAFLSTGLNIAKEAEMKTININGNTFTNGDDILLILGQVLLIRGKIHIHDDVTFFICHDNRALSGSVSPETYGLPFSYLMRSDERDIMVYHDFKLEIAKLTSKDNFFRFLKPFGYTIETLFSLKLGVTDLYETISGSAEQGYVELHSRARSKKLAIRLGRLIKKMVTAFNKVVITNPKNTKGVEINDELIEKIHNKWMAMHPGAITYKIVSGTDILSGYTKKNYIPGGSSLQGSCMTDKLNYLNIYTENPEKISMMIFYSADKICGRTLIWKCDDGKTYHDRVYVGIDWMTNKANEILKNEGIERLAEDNKVTINKIDFDNYPYMDHFYSVHLKKKVLYFDPQNKIKAKHMIRNTGGQIAETHGFIEEE